MAHNAERVPRRFLPHVGMNMSQTAVVLDVRGAHRVREPMSSDDVTKSEADDAKQPARPDSFSARQADHDRTLAAVHALEAALATAAPGRERGWREEVVSALAELDRVTGDESSNADRPDSLLSDIKRTQPRLASRVRGVRAQYRQIRDGIESLRREIEEPGDVVDVADIRERAGWVLAALRRQRARESDLIYEAYYDAFRADLPRDGDQAVG